MKFRWILFAIIILSLGAEMCFGQPDGPPGRMGMGRERLERFRKMRLIEALKLNEESAARFVAKLNTHEEAMRDVAEQRMKLIDDLENLAKREGTEKEFQTLFEKIDENEQKMFDERRRFRKDVRSILTTEQAAKYIIFDRNFTRELREAMEDMRRERRRR
jgi:chromosomal replication initiation ATPase DnaA